MAGLQVQTEFVGPNKLGAYKGARTGEWGLEPSSYMTDATIVHC